MPNVTKTSSSRADMLHAWSIPDALETYKVRQWGAGFFGINDRGHHAYQGLAPDIGACELSQESLYVPAVTRSQACMLKEKWVNASFGR